MKQAIHTFEIWDAFEAKTDCPICDIQSSLEKSYISGLFRDMTMDDGFCSYLKDSRFCSKHLNSLFNYRDKFGLALIINKILSFEIAELEAAQIANSEVVEKRTAFQAWIEKFITPASVKYYKKDKKQQNCHLCSHIEERTEDYIATLIELWENNLSFRALYYMGNGFCHQHFQQIVNHAKKELKDEELDNFLYTTIYIQQESIKKLNEELQWFIKKFNYHYNDEPWGNSKDSLARCLSKMK